MKKYNVTVNGTVYEVGVEEIKPGAEGVSGSVVQMPAAVPETEAPLKSAGGETVEAPMPGTVLDIKVLEGQRVNSGDTLLILEAMKMENEIAAPATGTVESIRVQKGSAVNAGEVLVVLK